MTSDVKLTKEQKQSVFLLSLGTFLEYFDLMLYVHMAVLLNELFFPQSDPKVAQLLGVFTFCSTFVLRPIGGFVIGRIGDLIGRKKTIIVTTVIMSLSCLTIANLPTYNEIGIAATIIMISCRALQGFSSMGESVGAQLYISEVMTKPDKYVYSGLVVDLQAILGGFFALIVASLTTSFVFNWRLSFWFGAVIAIVGLIARTKLRETPEFVNYKLRMKIKEKQLQNQIKIVLPQDKVNVQSIIAYFFVRFLGPFCFCITYLYMGDVMKYSLSMTAEQVINQNTKVSMLTAVGSFMVILLYRKYHPIKIGKIIITYFVIFSPFLLYLLNNIININWMALALLQTVMFSPVFCLAGVEVACFKYMPVGKRFTLLATTFGFSAAISYSVTSFSMIPLTEYLGHYGLLVLYVPVLGCFFWSLKYIEKLERESGSYLNYPHDDNNKDPSADLAIEDFEDKELYEPYKADCHYSINLLRAIDKMAMTTKSKVNIPLITKAIIFAKKWHDGQKRKTGEPFYSHPLAVAKIVTEYCFKTDVIVAAILHDVVEDSDCTVDLIQREFNPRIAEMVYRLTRVRVNQNGEITKLSVPDLIDEISQANDQEAMLVKEIDRLHNIYTIEGMKKEKQIQTANETVCTIMPHIAYTLDKLSIKDAAKLENKIFAKSIKTFATH